MWNTANSLGTLWLITLGHYEVSKGTRLGIHCLDGVDKTMQGSRRSQLGNLMRFPDFIVFTELYKQPKVASFYFLVSPVTLSCNLLAVAMEMARESWLIRSEEILSPSEAVTFKSSIQIIYENWVTVPYGNCKCCYLNWLKGMKMTLLISSLLYPMGPLRLLCLICV